MGGHGPCLYAGEDTLTVKLLEGTEAQNQRPPRNSDQAHSGSVSRETEGGFLKVNRVKVFVTLVNLSLTRQARERCSGFKAPY